jgi:hypothetical protein
MLASCTNPGCCAPFAYGEGRIFRFPCSAHCVPRNSHGVQHFWLCRDCSETYTLEYRKDAGIIMRCRFLPQPLPSVRIAAA